MGEGEPRSRDPPEKLALKFTPRLTIFGNLPNISHGVVCKEKGLGSTVCKQTHSPQSLVYYARVEAIVAEYPFPRWPKENFFFWVQSGRRLFDYMTASNGHPNIAALCAYSAPRLLLRDFGERGPPRCATSCAKNCYIKD